jgi:DNA modification methylase
MKVKIESIVIGDRFRKELGDFSNLTESIKKTKGRFVTVWVDKEMNLIAGYRRLCACREAGIDEVEALVGEEADELLRRELELEENLARKDMTDVEKTDGIAEIHRLRVAKYGAPTTAKGEGTSGWSVADTAKVISMSQSNVNLHLRVAEAKAKSPAVAEKLAKEGLVAAYKLALYEGEQEAMKMMVEAAVADTPTVEEGFDPTAVDRAREMLWKGDCLELIKRIPDGSIDMIHTDSPYGIDIQKLHSKAGSFSADLYSEDSSDYYSKLVTTLAPEYFRVLRANGWLFWWLHFDQFEFCKSVFAKAGFSYQGPFIWAKIGGRYPCYDPGHKYASGIDSALLFMKGQPVFLKQGQPNFSLCRSLDDSEKVHSLERPPKLVGDILETFVHPGHTVLDTFAGGGSTAKAAIDLGIDSINMELEDRYYNALLLQLIEKLGGPKAPLANPEESDPLLEEFPILGELGYNAKQVRRMNEDVLAKIISERISAEIVSICPDGTLRIVEPKAAESAIDWSASGEEEAASSTISKDDEDA